MNIITCVASYTGEHILEFLQIYSECIKGDIDHKLLILQTGIDPIMADMQANFFPFYHARKVLEPMPRYYASVMYEKVRFVEEFADEETIFINIDEDYDMNPRFLKFTHQIMEENPQVDYLSLLRGPGVIVDKANLSILSGFRFFRWGSCMGGSMTARWRSFIPVVNQFFRKFKVSGNKCGAGKMFDRVFFDFLKVVVGSDGSVYTTYDFSLLNHCRIGSNYREDGIDAPVLHLYGESFDRRLDPWRLQIS